MQIIRDIVIYYINRTQKGKERVVLRALMNIKHSCLVVSLVGNLEDDLQITPPVEAMQKPVHRRGLNLQRS